MTRGTMNATPSNKRRMATYVAGIALCTFMVLCLTGYGAVRADEQVSPDAAAILDRFVEVTGGKAAYEKIHNRVTKKRLAHVGMGFEDSVVEYEAVPNKRYVIIESEALGSVRQGTDGEVVWYLTDQTGPLVEQGEPRAAGIDNAAFDRIVNWRTYYKKAQYAGEEVLDGKSCHKVVLTPYHGEAETRYYDKESNLLVKVRKSRLSSHMPTMQAELTLSDYRAVDGVLIPHKTKHVADMCGSKREMLFVTESLEHNVELPSDRFDPPAEVRAVVKQEAGRSGTKQARRTPCGSAKTASSEKATGKAKRAPCPKSP